MAKLISYFDRISSERQRLLFLTYQSNLIVALIISIGVFAFLPSRLIVVRFLLSIFFFGFFGFSFHLLRKYFFNGYRKKLQRIKEIESISTDMEKRVEKIYQRFPKRYNGQQFKVAFSLQGRELPNFEETLAAGMLKESKEVFVTAFMKNNKAVRVTATIGREEVCFNSDDMGKWRYHLDRLKCDRILQYHNHPGTDNKTKPSYTDLHTTKKIKKHLGEHSGKLRSYIIYWNKIREWRVLEYDENGKCELTRWLDVSSARPDNS